MFKVAHHPKAFLTLKRNVQRGLLARTRIIVTLEKEEPNAKKLAQETSLSYASVLHHLHLLESENTLTRKGKRPYIWELTGAGQQKLTDVGSEK
jgi:predicted ArsR family transcriptional regulator